MKQEHGEDFKISDVNLAELERMTGISRGRLRRIQKDGFIVKPHGNTGKERHTTVLSGYTGVIDGLLKKNVKNSNTVYKKLLELGYSGGKTQIKHYIRNHRKRQTVRWPIEIAPLSAARFLTFFRQRW